MEVLCPKVSMAFLGTLLLSTMAPPVWLLSSAAAVAGGGCLFSDEELSPALTLFAVRRGSDELDCEPVLIESESVCCTRAAPPLPLSLLLLLFSAECGGWFRSHVFIMDKPIELVVLPVPPSPPPPPPTVASSG